MMMTMMMTMMMLMMTTMLMLMLMITMIMLIITMIDDDDDGAARASTQPRGAQPLHAPRMHMYSSQAATYRAGSHPLLRDQRPAAARHLALLHQPRCRCRHAAGLGTEK